MVTVGAKHVLRLPSEVACGSDADGERWCLAARVAILPIGEKLLRTVQLLLLPIVSIF